MSNDLSSKLKKHFCNFFKDKDGNVVIAQFPNWPLFLAAIFYILKYTNIDILLVVGQWGFFVTMIYWSYLEIRYGVNSWRKLLGLLVIFSLLKPLIVTFL